MRSLLLVWLTVVSLLIAPGLQASALAQAQTNLLVKMYQMGEARQADAVDYIITKLEDPDATTRRVAARALGKIGDPVAVKPLIELADDPYQPATVRSVAMSSLARIKCTTALPCLERIEMSGNYLLKTKARLCIQRIMHE